MWLILLMYIGMSKQIEEKFVNVDHVTYEYFYNGTDKLAYKELIFYEFRQHNDKYQQIVQSWMLLDGEDPHFFKRDDFYIFNLSRNGKNGLMNLKVRTKSFLRIYNYDTVDLERFNRRYANEDIRVGIW